MPAMLLPKYKSDRGNLTVDERHRPQKERTDEKLLRAANCRSAPEMEWKPSTDGPTDIIFLKHDSSIFSHPILCSGKRLQ